MTIRIQKQPFWGMSAMICGLIVALTGAGCSQSESDSKDAPGSLKTVRVILDFLPNPIHTGLFTAKASGLYTNEGLLVEIDQPTSTTDTLRLMSAGRASFGYVPMIDFLKAREAGEPIVIVSAVVQASLAAVHVAADSGIRRPRDLEGRLVGVSGVASDIATVRSIVRNDGGDPDMVKTINIGFNVVQNLVGKRVDGAVGFWNHEGVQLQAVQETLIFKEDQWGVPRYPGIVMFAREETLENNPEMVRAFLKATAAGYEASVADPETALQYMAREIEGGSAEELKPYYNALAPIYLNEAGHFGEMNAEDFQQFLNWCREMGILSINEKAGDLYSNAYLPYSN